MARFRPFAALTSQQSYNMLAFSIGIIAAGFFLWVIATLLLWAGGIIVTLLLVGGLGFAVFWKDQKLRQRERRIFEGRCADCGHDLHGTGAVCPQCGRDAGLDEPTWRKRQREHQLLVRAAAGLSPLITPAPVAVAAPAQTAVPGPLPADLTPAPTLR